MEEIKKKLRARARVKYMQTGVLQSLIDLNNERQSHYLKATTCCRGAVVTEGKLTMRYCRSRVCQVCNRNRSGRLINSYGEQIKQGSYRFLTLTIPNVSDIQLKEAIEEMKIVLLYIRRKFARDSRQLNGLYTIETTYNWMSDSYHPHIHCLIDAEVEECFEIVKQWINAWGKRGVKCSPQAQDIRKADDGALSEVFKYAIKFDYTMARSDGKAILKYSAEAIDTILSAIWGKRMVITFGNIRAVDEDYQEEAVLNWSEENDVYLWSVCDWFSITTGEALSDFTPSEVPNNRRRRGVRQRRGERIAYPEGQKTQFFN